LPAAGAESSTLGLGLGAPLRSGRCHLQQTKNQTRTQNSATAQEEGSKKKVRVGCLGHPARNCSFPVLEAILFPQSIAFREIGFAGGGLFSETNKVIRNPTTPKLKKKSRTKARVGFLGHPPRNCSFPVLEAILFPQFIAFREIGFSRGGL